MDNNKKELQNKMSGISQNIKVTKYRQHLKVNPRLL